MRLLPPLLTLALGRRAHARSAATDGSGRPHPREQAVVVAGDSDAPHGRNAASTAALVEDIERRVVHAGGNVEGVLVASLGWSTPDDLDLHVAIPGGQEISFSSRRAGGGELDVDMCVHGRGAGSCAEKPVENVVFADSAPKGLFKVYVQNFNYHPDVQSREVQVSRLQQGQRATKEERELRLTENRPVLFDLLVTVEGRRYLFLDLCTPPSRTRGASNVRVFEFEYLPGAEEPVASQFRAANNSACLDHKRRLIEAGGGEVGEPGRARQPARPPERPGASGKGRPAAAGAGSKASRAQQRKRAAALEAVRASSREVLQSKPLRALRELLQDLGGFCRGCAEKADFVERLLEAAGGDEL
ncbi:unnamed protein product [Prorocentrum cordatum]|uniref:ARMET C-terminal domain-containing protein n=1 Tax=Prorocentrum cordatum TaxID=2364126 RepID=A0ABN9TLA7_9DINO|nr:unnamed protein product [Polarella glacialis]